MLTQFFIVLKDYFIEVLPFLAAGFLLSGVIYEFVPARLVEKHLGGGGIRPLVYSSLFGAALPICCVGSLPVAVSLYQKGARLGAVLAFLVATPATSIPALLVCYALLGLKFTVYIFFAAIAMALLAGVTGNALKVKTKISGSTAGGEIAIDPVCGMRVVKETAAGKTEYQGETYYFCNPHCQQEFEKAPQAYLGAAGVSFMQRVKNVLQYAFVDMVKRIGLEILLGLALAAAVVAFTPVSSFVGDYLGGVYGYLFSLAFGLMMYICSTASVPLVHAFISQGMNVGAGMVLLMAGPVTSWGTILVLRKEFGGRTLLVYLTLISVFSLAAGYIFSLI